MGNLKKLIDKRKGLKEIEQGGFSLIVAEITENLVTEKINQLASQLISQIRSTLTAEIRTLVSTVKKGDKGETGNTVVGPAGAKGDKGDKGEQGAMGDKPIAGKDFEIPSLAGPEGKAGKDADTEMLQGMIEGIKKEREKDLESFEKKMSVLSRGIQEVKSQKGGGGVQSGGGMGKPLHETFACDGATTEFTLASNVAAAGNAIWVYYNGQFLLKDTHYSVSGKVITTTFTPEADTNIDLTYIRT